MKSWLQEVKMDVVFGVVLFFIAVPLIVWYFTKGLLEELD